MAKKKPSIEVFDGDGEVSIFEKDRITEENVARREIEWANREKIAARERKQDAAKAKREQKKQQAKRNRERAKRKVFIGCARYEIPKLAPYKDQFIVKIMGCAEQPFNEHEIFKDETCKQITFRTPGQDAPDDPWRLPVCWVFDNPVFKSIVVHPLYREEDPDSILPLSETQPYMFEITFYCSARRNIPDDRKAKKNTGRTGKTGRRSKRRKTG